MSVFRFPPAAFLRTPVLVVSLAIAVAGLGGCANMAQKISEIGSGPKLSPTEDPTQRPDYKVVSMPMPTPREPEQNINSLWRTGARTFFKDARATQVGDILTVDVQIGDRAVMQNSTTASRTGTEGYGSDNFLGLGRKLSGLLPGDKDDPLSPKLTLDSSSGSSGSGNLSRTETISVQVAAVITQILPNGNMVVAGRQEVRVNSEMRQLTVTGVIRPNDIDAQNVISSDKIAEARIYYGGRGTLSDVQTPRYGQQLFDIIFPF